MSLTTDDVRPSQLPNSWNIGSLTGAGALLAVCLLAFCSGILAVGKFQLGLEIDDLQTLAFIALVFGGQAIIYAIRDRRRLWGSSPSLWLVVSSVADIAIAAILAVAGIAMAPLPAWMIASAFAAAVLFGVVLSFVKLPVFRRLGLS